MCKAMMDWREEILEEGIERGFERGIEQGIERGVERGIEALILDNVEEGIPEKRILEKLQKRFGLDVEAARSCFSKYAACP